MLRPTLRLPLLAVFALVAGLAALPAPTRADASEEDFDSLRKAMKSVIDKPGLAPTKRKVVVGLGALDSAEAVDLLFDWHTKSAAWEEKELLPAASEAAEKLAKYEAMLRKSVGDKPPTDARQVNALKDLKKSAQDAQATVDAEKETRRQIERAVGSMGPTAAAWLMHEGLPGLRKKPKDSSVNLRIAAVRCVVAQPFDQVRDAILASAGPVGTPKEQVIAFGALAKQKDDAGFSLVAAGLKSPHVIVRRAAAWSLRDYSQPRAVPPLIDALAKAAPFEAKEIEEILHWYTGQSFQMIADGWEKWWTAEGAAWSESDQGERHPPVEATQASTGVRATFYDIPTESQAIVFVLDRSGSMEEPAGEKSRTKDDRPKGPVTGGGDSKDKKGAEDEPVAGQTRLEVAKNKLAQSINGLARDVSFSVVFYGSKVIVWKESPRLEPATQDNKAAAIEWFMGLKPEGSTALFDALIKALEYADTEEQKKGKKKGTAGGANTIFLLSDGSPTDASGQTSPEVISEGMERFLQANELYRCVVHTIGIGPQHNRTMMKNLAAATGGQYRAVGVD